MKKKKLPERVRKPRVRMPVTLGHRVDPEIKEMIQHLSMWRHQTQREILEAAIRELYRTTGLRMSE